MFGFSIDIFFYLESGGETLSNRFESIHSAEEWSIEGVQGQGGLTIWADP